MSSGWQVSSILKASWLVTTDVSSQIMHQSLHHWQTWPGRMLLIKFYGQPSVTKLSTISNSHYMFTTCIVEPQFWQTFYSPNWCIWQELVQSLVSLMLQARITLLLISVRSSCQGKSDIPVEKECLAINLPSKPSKSIYPFKIQTDHRALVWLDCLKENNAWLTRWSLSLQPYVYSVCHRTGKANGNADALSHTMAN